MTIKLIAEHLTPQPCCQECTCSTFIELVIIRISEHGTLLLGSTTANFFNLANEMSFRANWPTAIATDRVPGWEILGCNPGKTDNKSNYIGMAGQAVIPLAV